MLFEVTSHHLRSKAEKKVKVRSQKISSKFAGLRGNILYFLSLSATIPGKKWKQQIDLVELPKHLEKPGGIWKKVVKALDGDIRIRCDCPAFKYWGYWYIGGVFDYLIGKKTRRNPHIRNPSLKGTVCKHLNNVLSILKSNTPEIVQAIKRRRKNV